MRTANLRVLALVGLALLAILASGCSLLSRKPSEEKLLSALASDDREARRQALLEVEPTQGAPDVRKAVEGILANDLDPTTRGLAADALGRLGSRESAAELRLSARKDVHWVVRQRALRALVQILGGDAAEDIELSLKSDPAPAVRVEAVKLAAKTLDSKKAALLLVESLKDTAGEVKLTAHAELKVLTGADFSPNDYKRWRELVEKPQAAPENK